MYPTTINSIAPSNPKLEKLLREKKAGRELQERKHSDWQENYELYRNKVRTNRLTQRQAVNIPLMKETIKTILSKIDDSPNVDWKEKSGDEMKELIYQEIWTEQFKKNKFEWKDVLDKKNVLLYGLSSKFLYPTDTGVDVDIPDVYDIIFDPLMNPVDIETARFIVRQNIFRNLRDILADKRYSEAGKAELKKFRDTEVGLIQSNANLEVFKLKMERLQSMGVSHGDFPYYAGGDVMVNLTEHYTNHWNGKEFERRVAVYADDVVALLDEKLEDLIGVDFWPFVLWMEDPESTDVYPDGIADLVRTPNKILNVWFSQHVENRTLQNFQMHWYDATKQGYTPQTYEPGPGVMLPAPGNPKETIMPVEINGLDESFTAIDYLTKVIERGTGAVALEKGVAEQGTQTLGEVQILIGAAQERSLAMAKFYRNSWYETAWKWSELMHANPPKSMKLYKTGRSGKLYEKVVTPKDWKSDAGYEPLVSSTSEQEADQIKTLQKFNYVIQQNPNNIALKRIGQKRQLESLDLAPDELNEIEMADKQAEEMALTQAQTPQAPQAPIQAAPLPVMA